MTRPDKKKRPPPFDGGQPIRSKWRPVAAKAGSTSTTAAVVVFAKAPIVGQVKTRLCPPLTPDEAASLHGSLVMDMLERSQAVKGCDLVLAGSPDKTHPFFKAMEARFKVKLWEQVGEDLGARMARTFHAGLGSTYRSLVIVGTDIPGITPQIVTQAFASLKEHDLVLGPTMDGGYYLIGLRKKAPELFQDIPWSTDQVCPLTEQKAKVLGLSMKKLPTLRDIDTIEDLQAITRGLNHPGTNLVSQRTKNVLLELSKRLKTRGQG
ncbi:MAG: TIGR04282 family arsenosugar biosynthesis glycosyltransferase [Nitrospirales bacterium]|nr:TIGR04282 family arsenosugar biosynthesis glycosyltransferase [Nitrospirales bacterium]